MRRAYGKAYSHNKFPAPCCIYASPAHVRQARPSPPDGQVHVLPLRRQNTGTALAYPYTRKKGQAALHPVLQFVSSSAHLVDFISYARYNEKNSIFIPALTINSRFGLQGGLFLTFPEDFTAMIAPLLGAEYNDFLDALNHQPILRGLRVNTRKISCVDFVKRTPFALTPSPLCRDAFTVAAQTPLGLHPYHYAGLYYVQDPSASAAVEAMNPQPGEWILDLCAAPGGKSTHIAARIGDGPGSLLVANEIVPRRAKILSSNLERIGARNAVVCCASPEDFAQICPETFDAVLVDAPCSGEGMFRRDPEAVREYSAAHVQSCVVRQNHILDSAAQTVRPGGRLVYSTCTFNPYENEGVVDAFLSRHPDFSIGTISYPPLPPGRPEWGGGRADLVHTGRLMPHLCPGEGHFIALLRRSGNAARPECEMRTAQMPTTAEQSLFASFWEENFTIPIYANLHRHDEFFYLAPLAPALPHLLRSGVCAARLARNRIEPCHALYLSLDIDEIRNKLIFSPESSEISAFLRGEVLKTNGFPGWTAIGAGDETLAWPLGFGKISAGICKNHYPKGLRI